MPFIFGFARSEPSVAFRYLYKAIPSVLAAFFDVVEVPVVSMTIDHSEAEA